MARKFHTVMIARLTLLAGSLPGSADPRKDRQCELLGDIAEEAMKYRQKRMLLVDLLKSHHRAASADFALILDSVAVRAFSVPAFLTPELQQRAVARFRDEVLQECVGKIDQPLVEQEDLAKIDALVGEGGCAAFIHEAITKLLNATEQTATNSAAAK